MTKPRLNTYTNSPRHLTDIGYEFHTGVIWIPGSETYTASFWTLPDDAYQKPVFIDMLTESVPNKTTSTLIPKGTRIQVSVTMSFLMSLMGQISQSSSRKEAASNYWYMGIDFCTYSCDEIYLYLIAIDIVICHNRSVVIWLFCDHMMHTFLLILCPWLTLYVLNF